MPKCQEHIFSNSVYVAWKLSMLIIFYFFKRNKGRPVDVFKIVREKVFIVSTDVTGQAID